MSGARVEGKQEGGRSRVLVVEMARSGWIWDFPDKLDMRYRRGQFK